MYLLSLLQQRRDRLPNHSIRAESPSKSFTDAPANNTLHCSNCRSITCITSHIYDDPSSSSPNLLHLHPPSSNPMIKALGVTLRFLSRDITPAPSLRRIALHYTSWSFTHELEHARLANLPSHTCTPSSSAFAQRLRQIYLRCFALPMPGVQSLKIYGTCSEFVADVASACPALHSLETNDDDAPEVLFLQSSTAFLCPRQSAMEKR